MGKNPFIAVLSIKPFRNLWLSQLFSQVFLNLLVFSLVIEIYRLTHSNAAVSLVIVLSAVPNVLLGALAGVLADRWDRKAIMFYSHFLRIFVTLAFLLASETVSWLYMLVILVNVVTQFFFPAEAATIREVVKDKKLLLTANSLFSVTFFASVILGNVLAGPLLRLVGLTWTFVIIAVAFAVAAIFTAKLPGRSIWEETVENCHGEFFAYAKSEVARLRGGEILSGFMSGLDYIYKHPAVKFGIMIMGLSQVTIAILGSVAPGFSDQILRVDVRDISLLVMAPAAVGMLMGAFVIGQFLRKRTPVSLVRIGLGSIGGIILMLAGVDFFGRIVGVYPWVLALGMLVFLGGANAFLDVPANTLVQENTPEQLRSRIYGVISSIVGLAVIFPVALAGTLADAFGVRAVMVIGGMVVMILTWYVRLNGDYASHSS